MKPTQQQKLNEARKKMRGKVIHYLCLLGYVDKNDKPDYERINNFIVNIGPRNPKKKILNYLYLEELNAVLTQVEAMYRHELSRMK